jgi:uncharacterized membrane protein
MKILISMHYYPKRDIFQVLHLLALSMLAIHFSIPCIRLNKPP